MDASWMNDLEAKVHQAAERLSALEAENEGLRGTVAELEKRLADEGDRAGWERERDEVRGRVESLTQRLEKLLES